MIRDVSVRGARILTRTPLSVGDRVTLNLYFGKEAEGSHPAAGKIVRVERRDPPHSEVWHWELGVEFDEAITQYAAEIEALCRQQEAAGVLKR